MNAPTIYCMHRIPPLVKDDSAEENENSIEEMSGTELAREGLSDSPINLLSEEVLVLIFERLPISSLCSTACTSKTWNKLVFDRSTLKGLLTHLMPDTLKRIEAKRLLGDRVSRLGKGKRRMVEPDYLHYLKTETRMRSSKKSPELKELKGHKGSVFCLKTTEDGTLVSGSGDGTVRIWSLESQEPLILPLNDSIQDMQIEEGNFYFRGVSNQVHVLSRNREDPEDAILNPGFPFSSFQVLGDFIYYGSKSGSIEIFDINTNKRAIALKSGNDACVTSLFVNDRVYAGFSSGKLQAFDIETGSVVQDFVGHNEMIKSFSVLGNQLYSGSFDGTIRAWDVRNDRLASVIYCKDHISCIDVIDHKIGSGSWDGLIRYFDARSSRILKTLGHTICVLSLHSNEGIIYGGSMGSTIRLWDFNA